MILNYSSVILLLLILSGCTLENDNAGNCQNIESDAQDQCCRNINENSSHEACLGNWGYNQETKACEYYCSAY